jgi:predicted DNA-binding transcriptional regulator AlpA
MPKYIYSIREVAALIGVHVATINRWCIAGIFVPKVRLGPVRFGFLVTDIEAWLAERRVVAA